ncbi:copper resistance protein CopC [Bacillus sp. ISL-4]|uniref:copper resistance CopC family protein n=1 Tax=Bacillus sp. ISL-4 TaxID=2819125 RepID=UPI001BEA2DCB|nr:copper resistance CopC family protein [Bacillus sp. ISL-4]MBT2666155.1 copper resistance protein CopC [Bacillus sp. ISL-4]MBT2670193.1 copper resistance protein CopC [Streptomyces sp. ISL-14]
MIKKLLFITLFFFIGFNNNAFAHTGLESSSPQDGEIVKKDIQDITLSFETKVEQGSTFHITDSNGKTIPLENITLNDNEMVGPLLKPLVNGTYQTMFKIIGADGHQIEGQYSFSVDIPKKLTQSEQDQTQKEEPKEEENKKAMENKEDEQKKLPSYLIPSVIAVLIIIGLGSLLMLMRRKE